MLYIFFMTHDRETRWPPVGLWIPLGSPGKRRETTKKIVIFRFIFSLRVAAHVWVSTQGGARCSYLVSFLFPRTENRVNKCTQNARCFIVVLPSDGARASSLETSYFLLQCLIEVTRKPLKLGKFHRLFFAPSIPSIPLRFEQVFSSLFFFQEK